MLQVSQLRVDLADFDQQNSFAKYSAFAIGSELEKYSLKMLGEFTGDAGETTPVQYIQNSQSSSVKNAYDIGKSRLKNILW